MQRSLHSSLFSPFVHLWHNVHTRIGCFNDTNEIRIYYNGEAFGKRVNDVFSTMLSYNSLKLFYNLT